MKVTFDSIRTEAWPDDDVGLGFTVENPADRRLGCAYRLQTSGAGTVGGWEVDGPTGLAGGERSHGELRLRAPQNRGRDPLSLRVRLLVSTGDPDEDAEDTCTLVVRPTRVGLRPTLTPSPDGTVAAKLSLLKNGRSRVDAGVKLRHKGGWRFSVDRPTVTVHTASGPRRLRAPRARWSMPDVTLNPDGTVTVKMSLFNHGGVDVNASVRLRHGDGWSFSAESPELTVKAQQGSVDVSATFRPPPGRRVGPGDEVSLELRVNGVPIAETTVRLRSRSVPIRHAAAFGAAMLSAAAGVATLVDHAQNEPTVPIVVTSTSVPQEPTVTTAPPQPGPTTTTPDPGPTATTSVAPEPATVPTTAGVAAPVVTPRRITFGVHEVDGAPRTVWVSNEGTAPFRVEDVRLTGEDAAFYGYVNQCRGVTVEPGRACEIRVSLIDPGDLLVPASGATLEIVPSAGRPLEVLLDIENVAGVLD